MEKVLEKMCQDCVKEQHPQRVRKSLGLMNGNSFLCQSSETLIKWCSTGGSKFCATNLSELPSALIYYSVHYKLNLLIFQGTTCLESGSYLLNFASCKECGRKEPLKIIDKSNEEDDDGEELVTFKRT